MLIKEVTLVIRQCWQILVTISIICRSKGKRLDASYGIQSFLFPIQPFDAVHASWFQQSIRIERLNFNYMKMTVRTVYMDFPASAIDMLYQ